ncbi:nicalin-1-like [Dorcoceras hygrometricum]|uniref:Nicalin-1-like n=1 Tax=Dorcoceras hygrometricum TaxID=472368 RepID=A0A2Z7C4E3_9LAMI|nr:nicalin-1-like [Dorcoceras hygrometricum]
MHLEQSFQYTSESRVVMSLHGTVSRSDKTCGGRMKYMSGLLSPLQFIITRIGHCRKDVLLFPDDKALDVSPHTPRVIPCHCSDVVISRC